MEVKYYETAEMKLKHTCNPHELSGQSFPTYNFDMRYPHGDNKRFFFLNLTRYTIYLYVLIQKRETSIN